MSYFQFAKNYYSANGEDGITEQLFKDLNINDGVVCEFGAWDGFDNSNTAYFWFTKDFSAILIEGLESRFDQLVQNTKSFDVTCIKNMVQESGDDSIDNILDRSMVKLNDDNFALMSIDIDSFDYYVFGSIKKYRPKVCIVETSSGYTPDQDFVSRNAGCSLKSVAELGETIGYKCVIHTGNAYFVRDDLVHLLPDYDYSLDAIYSSPSDIDSRQGK